MVARFSGAEIHAIAVGISVTEANSGTNAIKTRTTQAQLTWEAQGAPKVSGGEFAPETAIDAPGAC